MTNIADSIAPSRTTTHRIRRSDPWFDDECRAAKRECRQLERRARRSSADDAITSTWRDKCRCYRRLISEKRTTFWTDQIETLQQQPRQMWRVIDDLLGRVNNTACSTSLTANDFSKFFADKVASIRASTCGAPDPFYTVAPPQCHLDCFSRVSEADVLDAIKSLPTKQCDLDPMPTWLLKANSVCNRTV